MLSYGRISLLLLTCRFQALLKTIKEWPNTIYDVAAVIVAVQSELDRVSATASAADTKTLIECLAELYLVFHLLYLLA